MITPMGWLTVKEIQKGGKPSTDGVPGFAEVCCECVVIPVSDQSHSFFVEGFDGFIDRWAGISFSRS